MPVFKRGTTKKVIQGELVKYEPEDANLVKSDMPDTVRDRDLEIRHPDPSIIVIKDKHKGYLTRIFEEKRNGKTEKEEKFTPKIYCDNCLYTSNCQFYKPGYDCAFRDIIESHRIDSPEDVASALKSLTELDYQRAQQAAILEKLSGNNISKETTAAINNAHNKLVNLYDKITAENPRPRILQRMSPTVQNIQAFVNPSKQQEGDSQPSLLEHMVNLLKSAPRSKGGS